MFISLLIILLIVDVLGIGMAITYHIQKAAKQIVDSNSVLINKMDEIHSEVEKKGSVTDPFEVANRSNTIGASSRNIVLRKAPDQIRAENFQKLKEGAAYGHAE